MPHDFFVQRPCFRARHDLKFNRLYNYLAKSEGGQEFGAKPERFHDRDLWESSYGTAVPISLADDYVLNTGGIEEAFRAMDEIVKRRTPER